MKTCPVCGKEYSDTATLCPADAVVLEHTQDPLIGKPLASKYNIEELIKSGGMGSVYRGKHILMDKTVAIKVLRPSLAVDPAVVARFSREAKAASRINHPHAVVVTDFGEDENGVVFLVMEYLSGRTLKEIIRTEGPLELKRIVEIIRQVAGALDVAHSQGVIHRDLKSDNIMLSSTNGGEWAKVLDFGIAKIQQPEGAGDIEVTAANLVVGTPQYMSPEQCSQARPLDARSDVYSLGVIVFEMLTGRVPFTGDSPTVIMMKHVQDPPPSVLTGRPNLPTPIDDVVRRALAKQPADRFSSAGELYEALSRAVLTTDELSEAFAEAAAPVTVANAPVPAVDDADEETVVRVREPQTFVRQRPEPLPIPVETPIASFNPWRIMLPAVIVLVAVFGIVFLLTRSPGQTSSAPPDQINGLVTDPSGQPVQQMSPATGVDERGIQPSNSSMPTVSTQSASPTPNANSNRGGAEVLPSEVNGNFGENDNANTRRPNQNTNQPSDLPRLRPDESPPPRPSESPRPRRVGTPEAPG
jgi:eukaryotic-like serine/threonine-protein kinase